MPIPAIWAIHSGSSEPLILGEAGRAELASGGLAFLRLRIQPGEAREVYAEPAPIFDSLDQHRVTSSEWHLYEIVADVPDGAGTAWLDGVSVEAEEP